MGGFSICHALPPPATNPYATFYATFYATKKSELLQRRQAKRIRTTTANSTMGRLNVKVVPGSSRDQIVGWLGDALKIRVMAPPEKGKANEAVVELLSMKLGISTDDIEVESGRSSPSKVIAVTGMDDDAIKKAFK